MVRLAVVEDDAVFAQALASKLRGGTYGALLEVHVVPMDRDDISVFGGTYPDIAMMDIDLGDQKDVGIHIAKELNVVSPHTQVIYVTGHTEYAVPVYETDHVYALFKPVCDEDLDRAVGRALKNLVKHGERALLVEAPGMMVRIPHSSILFVESKRNVVEVNWVGGQPVSQYRKLDDVEEELNRGGATAQFVRCHKSFLVNLHHVMARTGDAFLLDTGEQVPISRRRLSESMAAWHAHVARDAVSRETS